MKIIPKYIKSKRHLCASGSILLPLAQKWSLVGVVAVAALSAFATQSVSAASLTVEIPTNPLTVNVSASGGFSEASGKVSVKGDAHWGYVLSIQSKNGKNALSSKEGNTISSITETKSKTQFPDNAWGYKFSKDDTDTSNDNFQPGPKGETQIDKTEQSEGHDYTFTIGTKVNENQPAGQYSNTFTVTATANIVSYNITYDCKGGSGCTAQSGASTEQSLKLNQPTRDGYKFLGYCTSSDVAALNEKRCTENAGTTYRPSDTYTLSKDGNTATLYAMWEPTTMQTFGDYCQAMDIEIDTLTLADVRDKNSYKVRKLKDNRCWMVENLRLGSDTEMALTPGDSDIQAPWTLPARSTAGFELDGSANLYIDDERGGYYTSATAGVDKAMLNLGQNVESSICPKGWTLPSSDRFNNLVQANGYSSGRDFIDGKSSLFTVNGYYNGKSLLINGDVDYYSSTMFRGSTVCSLGRDSAVSAPCYTGTANSIYGHNVRCIARD